MVWWLLSNNIFTRPRPPPLKNVRKIIYVIFPDGQSALMLVAARLRHVSTTQWGSRKYMNVGLLKEMDREVVFAAA